MPIVLFGALGAVGGALLVRAIMREARRINGELADIRGQGETPEPRATLRRDPDTGEYRVR